MRRPGPGPVAAPAPIRTNGKPRLSRVALPCPCLYFAADTSESPRETAAEFTVPTYFRVGGTWMVPVGFMDLASVWRGKDWPQRPVQTAGECAVV